MNEQEIRAVLSLLPKEELQRMLDEVKKEKRALEI